MALELKFMAKILNMLVVLKMGYLMEKEFMNWDKEKNLRENFKRIISWNRNFKIFKWQYLRGTIL